MGLCNRYEEICTRKGEGVFVVKRRERRVSRLQEVDLVFSIFFSHFILFSIHFTVFLFLELGLVLE